MNILGIDFEEWFHPELIQPFLGKEKKEFKIVKGINKILDWLRQNETFATFFVVGEILQKEPELLDKIFGAGHEIAFHTMTHKRLNQMGSKDSFEKELTEFKNITSGKAKGFRAPSFSLENSTAWALDSLNQFEYVYDSSIVPAKTNLYGVPNAKREPYKISSHSLEKNDASSKLWEFPILVTQFLGKRIPAGGGFFVRTLPMKIIEHSINQYEQKEIPATFYIHSWELTPEYMPRLELPIKEKFVTYHNVEKTLEKMDKLIKKFQFTSFARFIPNMKN